MRLDTSVEALLSAPSCLLARIVADMNLGAEAIVSFICQNGRIESPIGAKCEVIGVEESASSCFKNQSKTTIWTNFLIFRYCTCWKLRSPPSWHAGCRTAQTFFTSWKSAPMGIRTKGGSLFWPITVRIWIKRSADADSAFTDSLVRWAQPIDLNLLEKRGGGRWGMLGSARTLRPMPQFSSPFWRLSKKVHFCRLRCWLCDGAVL